MILHIVLTILKVLGIVLAVILGLVILLLLIVLLVPLRYTLEGKFHEEKEAGIRITWLLRLITAVGGYRDGIYYSLKVFGKTILSSEKKHPKEKPEEGQELQDEPVESMIDKPPEEEAGPGTEEAPGSPGEEKAETPEEETAPEEEEEPEETAGGKKKKKKAKKPKKPKPERPPLRERIEAFFDSLDEKLESFEETAEEISEKISWWQDFLTDEENQETFALLLREVMKILCHIRPRKMSGYLTLGLEDPYTMGQAMSAAAFLWPFYQEDFRFTPVFDEKIIDGEVSAVGRIRLGYVAVCAVRVLLDRNFRRILRMVLKK